MSISKDLELILFLFLLAIVSSIITVGYIIDSKNISTKEYSTTIRIPNKTIELNMKITRKEDTK